MQDTESIIRKVKSTVVKCLAFEMGIRNTQINRAFEVTECMNITIPGPDIARIRAWYVDQRWGSRLAAITVAESTDTHITIKLPPVESELWYNPVQESFSIIFNQDDQVSELVSKIKDIFLVRRSL